MPSKILQPKLGFKLNIKQAISLQKTKLNKLIGEGLQFHRQGNLVRARSIYEQILLLDPRHFDALQLLGAIENQEKNYDQALILLDQAIKINPNHAAVYCNYGNVLIGLNKLDLALVVLDRAIEIKLDYSEAYFNRGNVLQKLNRYQDALSSYDKAILLNPNYVDAYFNRGNLYQKINQLNDAIANYDKAITLKPNYAEVYVNRGNVLRERRQLKLAIASYDRAILLQPDHLNAYYNRGNVLQELRNFTGAIEDYERVIELNPCYPYLHGILLHTKLKICNWSNFDSHKNLILSKIQANERASTPFPLLAFSDSPGLQQACSGIYSSDKYPPLNHLGEIPRKPRGGRLRIGYFSADFGTHPVSFLTAELFELHDKSKFELFAFSFDSRPGDLLQLRIKAAFNQFIDVQNMSDRAVAELARNLSIDVAIDLGGYTTNCRTGIFSYRAAPVQVSYIGYLGTMSNPSIDYLIADSKIIPRKVRQYYSEKIIYLPSYQVNDSKRHSSQKIFSRKGMMLPDDSFIFCCFNNSYKILPATFDCWMRILNAVQDSVLFLYAENRDVESNLLSEAKKRGIDESRLIFAGRIPYEDYLARYNLCDLFLDTYPYNAGTTASDALWMGLPVITVSGETFPSRVASSLLNALNMNDLVTSSQADYEDLAIEIATNKKMFLDIKKRLADNRFTARLFDTSLFVNNLESAFLQVMERHWSGMPPEDLSVNCT